MSATQTQVGGNHYAAMRYQPIELVGKIGLNFFQGNILKYLSRFRRKNGQEDLLKAIHYCQLAKEYKPRNVAFGRQELVRFAIANGMDDAELGVLNSIYDSRWDDATRLLNEIRKKFCDC